MKPSLLTSTLSLMAVLSLVTVIACVISWTEIKWELLAVLTGIIWAYTGARLPNKEPENKEDLPNSQD